MGTLATGINTDNTTSDGAPKDINSIICFNYNKTGNYIRDALKPKRDLSKMPKSLYQSWQSSCRWVKLIQKISCKPKSFVSTTQYSSGSIWMASRLYSIAQAKSMLQI